jgi:hypothetical protein
MTVLDHLLRSLAFCANHNGNDVVSPHSILWPDGERLWEPVFGRLCGVHPRLITLARVAKKST